MRTSSTRRGAFVFLLTTAFMRDVFAATVGLTYFVAGTNCATADSLGSETDPVGTCTKEPLVDGSTSATLDATENTITFKAYTSDTCTGNPSATQTCKCGACCTNFVTDDYGTDGDVKLDCSKARDAATEQVTIQYYSDAQCLTIFTTETDQVGVCTKEAEADEWSIATLSGNTVSFASYSDAACTTEAGGETSCGCSNTCCTFGSGAESFYYTVGCPAPAPPPAVISTSTSAAGAASRLHGFGGVLMGAFFMLVSSRWF